jgi:hypothetical protein
MTLDQFGHIASIITALVALIGVYPLFKSLWNAERNLRFQVFRDVLELMEDSHTERQLLEKKISETEFNVDNATDEERRSYERIIRTWDKLGLLVKHGVVPLDFVLDFYSRPLVLSWRYLEPLVIKKRLKRKQPGHRIKFEILAKLAQQDRQKNYPNEDHYFNVSKEDLKQWRNWKTR